MDSVPRPIPYLLVGHVAKDLTPQGPTLGGTVAYAGLTAAALGAQVAIVTACATDIDLQPLADLELITHTSAATTTFINRDLPSGRAQTIQAHAGELTLEMIPAQWRNAAIIHLAPIAAEVDRAMLEALPSNSVYMTPQGWLRSWDSQGKVELQRWEQLIPTLTSASAIVCSIEDLGGDTAAPDEMAAYASTLVVTRGESGATLFVDRQRFEIPGLEVDAVDTTGSGDIFAAAFFTQLSAGRSPWYAAQFANHLAACSVRRSGLNAVPSSSEIASARGSF